MFTIRYCRCCVNNQCECDGTIASKVVYWPENLAGAPQWVREFVTEHQPPTVRTWANGYGLWFARVPVSDNAASVAKAAIMSELRQRESNVCESRVSVELVTGNRDTVVYREVDPDESPNLESAPYVNRYPEHCADCNSTVSAGEGILDRHGKCRHRGQCATQLTTNRHTVEHCAACGISIAAGGGYLHGGGYYHRNACPKSLDSIGRPVW